jgi:hypothetical protein
MITWEELEKIMKDCKEAKGSPMGVKLIEAGLIEKLVGQIAADYRLLVCINKLAQGDASILPLSTWHWVRAIGRATPSVFKAMHEEEKAAIRNSTKPFADDFAEHNPKGEMEVWCDREELGIITIDDEEKKK